MEDEKWVEQMYEKYGHLFEKYEGDEDEHAYYRKGAILRGIEVAGHWKQPIEDMLEELEWQRTHNTHIDNPDYNKDEPVVEGNFPCIPNPDGNKIQIFQIKEKFGRLTVYVSSNNPRLQSGIDRAVARADARAGMICSNCGRLQYNLNVTKGWIRYVCDECYNEK